MKAETLAQLLQAQAQGRTVVLATHLRDGEQIVLPESAAPPGLLQAAEDAIRRDESRLASADGASWFLRVYAPPPRLLIVGAVHIAQSLAPLAEPCGFDVTIVDPRRAFATPERFPGITLVNDWPEPALDALKPDRRTAIVVLSHDPKLDDPALMAALRSDAFYVGALGSRQTHAARRARLAETGMGEAELARINGPVGLKLNAVSAAEIAVSILAEIIAVRRGGAAAAR